MVIHLQAEWKPEFPDRFSEISELVKSVDSLKLEDGKSQGLSLLVLTLKPVSDFVRKVYKNTIVLQRLS